MWFAVKAGWGDWAGPGQMQVSQKILKKRDALITKIQQENQVKKLDRKDAKKSNVIISEKRVKSFAKYKVDEIPFPFTSREEYERSLQLPLGGENTVVNLHLRPSFVNHFHVISILLTPNRGMECVSCCEEADGARCEDSLWSHHRANQARETISTTSC